MDALQLSTAQSFELERMGRVIDSTSDMVALKSLAKQLLQAWQGQKAATDWVMRQQLATPFQADSACRLTKGTADPAP